MCIWCSVVIASVFLKCFHKLLSASQALENTRAEIVAPIQPAEPVSFSRPRVQPTQVFDPASQRGISHEFSSINHARTSVFGTRHINKPANRGERVRDIAE